MKKILIYVAIVASLSPLVCAAQQDVTPGQKSKIVMAGHYNSTTVGGGSHATVDMAQDVYTASQNVLYSPLDTVDDAGTDSFKATLKGNYNSVYTWCHATSISGTNTSCTAKLYVSGDSGSGLDWVQVYSVTVGATNPIASYLINSGDKWPYSNFKWLFTGSGTHSTSWYSGVLIR